ncbi:MAG: nucleotidyltransferase domain-containing protein [Treponema sp.]|jgi:predicted nucleotidyltransferase|nr:nucleotidyltransferase domain-containing protein [Treponema sp.]
MENKLLLGKLEIIKKAILNKVDAKYIYLFGSNAYGEPNENSDIDIYAVIPDNFDKNILITTGEIYRNIANENIFFVDLVLVKENNFIEHRDYSFEKMIVNEGVLLYAS